MLSQFGFLVLCLSELLVGNGDEACYVLLVFMYNIAYCRGKVGN